MKKRVIIVSVCLLIFSCATQEVCEEGLKAEVIVTLKTSVNEVMLDTIVSGVDVYGIRTGKADSLLYDSAKVAKLLLPLDPNNDSSAFVIGVDSISDTITFYHSSTVYMISYTCGFANDFTLTGITFTANNLKDIELINDDVFSEDSDTEEHCRFYF